MLIILTSELFVWCLIYIGNATAPRVNRHRVRPSYKTQGEVLFDRLRKHTDSLLEKRLRDEHLSAAMSEERKPLKSKWGKVESTVNFDDHFQARRDGRFASSDASASVRKHTIRATSYNGNENEADFPYEPCTEFWTQGAPCP